MINDGNFKIDDSRFSWDTYSIVFQGFMISTTFAQLQAKYPYYQEVFQRLYQNYQVVPCSSSFRFK
ncbi:hypothetical protein D5R40_25485 [Okeania hirsuta]|uniref:Uncharacterized protein n=1 Tax=Okeania hirsuta TaxID=1458930 RepID=A0A3N6N5E8_9CYAN|nr:hypothetical protein D4Z78_26610 [Okeania hirsuta]RQH28509.1 hypothetical protein D5R40_25485 [Okeania hirsuta]